MAPTRSGLAPARQIPRRPLRGIGIATRAGGLYFLWREGEDPERDLAMGALLPSLFYLSQAVSFAFPGAKGAEYQAPEKIPRVGGVWINERFFSATMLALLAIGYTAGRRGERA